MTEEALLSSDRRPLADWVGRQPPWSDFPFMVLTTRGLSPDLHLPEMLGNVTVLERPFHPAVLANATQSALRARRRQREVEAHLQERQRTHERQALLIRELHHRVKNTLSTVQGLLGGTRRSSHSMDEFYHSFSDRIVALAKTHTLLTEDYWQMGSLQEMLTAELSPYNNHSLTDRAQGPAVELSADLAVPTGMAIHELTTNAAKYGALSVPEGQVRVVVGLGREWRGQDFAARMDRARGARRRDTEAKGVRLDAASACPDNSMQRGSTLRFRSRRPSLPDGGAPRQGTARSEVLTGSDALAV